VSWWPLLAILICMYIICVMLVTMALFRGAYGFKPLHEFFTVKNLNCIFYWLIENRTKFNANPKIHLHLPNTFMATLLHVILFVNGLLSMMTGSAWRLTVRLHILPVHLHAPGADGWRKHLYLIPIFFCVTNIGDSLSVAFHVVLGAALLSFFCSLL